MALLGLAVSEQTIIDYDVRNENLEVLRVLYQPEAESRARGARTGLRLVSNKVPARRQVGDLIGTAQPTMIPAQRLHS